MIHRIKNKCLVWKLKDKHRRIYVKRDNKEDKIITTKIKTTDIIFKIK